MREFGLLVALCAQAAGIVRREELYREVWGGRLRAGDRSIDVYVHKLRVKLEDGVPGTRFIHTHVGLRLPLRRPSLHTLFTSRSRLLTG